MTNPVIAQVMRGDWLESRHRGAYVVADGHGKVVSSEGDCSCAVFPRSAIKPLQCIPVIESGAADRFALTEEEIALCCASHNGEPDHVRVARSILRKIGRSESDYECGAHWPLDEHSLHDLVRFGGKPGQVHNNCSGKHAGMLAYAVAGEFDCHGYVDRTHPVQQAVADVLNRYCGIDTNTAPVGIDGCSVPTWAMPLTALAQGFARLCQADNVVGQRIIAAVRANPFMVAGTGRFDTAIMRRIPRLLIKVGAEGVYGGCIAHAGLGFALKVDDGAGRGAEVAIAAVLAGLDCWLPAERRALVEAASHPLINWTKIPVGRVRAALPPSSERVRNPG